MCGGLSRHTFVFRRKDAGISGASPRRGRTLLEHPRFELVPIKGVEAEFEHLPTGARVTVTCSASKGIEATLALSKSLREHGFDVVPHISARLVDGIEHLRSVVERLAEMKAEEIFVIGGDVPRPAGSFSSSLELMSALRALGYTGSIGVAAYPEAHPFIETEGLWRALAEKQALASYMVSQICFDAVRIVEWLREARERGIYLPLWVGFPGAIDRNKLMRVALRIGVGDSTRFLTKHGGLVSRLVRRGGYSPDELVGSLGPHLEEPGLDIAGYHINTFNQVASTERWRKGSLDATEGPSDSSAARS